MSKHLRFIAVMVSLVAIVARVASTSADGPLPAGARGLRTSDSHGAEQMFLPLVGREALLGDPKILAAGDTRSGCETGSFATLAILDSYPSSIPILHNGDFTNSGAAIEYADCYTQTWGKHKAQTRPVPGNHEYITQGAAGYFDYFGSLAMPQGESYYSFDVGAWHIVALNSEIDVSSTSAQLVWLEADLAAHPALCTLAYWHEPRWSSGLHGSNTFVSALWEILYDNNAELVLNGHDHDYERFSPQNPSGGLDEAHGIQEFVIGTGGVAEQPFGTMRANSQVRNHDTWGVLELTLHPASYEYKFIPASGGSFSDRGTMACH